MKKKTLINLGIAIAIFVVIMPVFYTSAIGTENKVQSKTKIRKFLNVVGSIEENRIKFYTYQGNLGLCYFYEADFKVDDGDDDTYEWRNTDRTIGYVYMQGSPYTKIGCYQSSYGDFCLIDDHTQYLEVTSKIVGWQCGSSSDYDTLIKHGSTWGWWNLVTSSSTW